MNFAGFATWNILLDFINKSEEFQVQTNGKLYYHAPLDRLPYEIEVMKQYKNGSLRIKVKLSKHGGFIVNSSHLERFKISC